MGEPLCWQLAHWYRAAYPESKRIAAWGRKKTLERNDRNFAVLHCTNQGARLGLTTDRELAKDWMKDLGGVDP
jgi:hypothetical protein